jgi:hypothetical protein
VVSSPDDEPRDMSATSREFFTVDLRGLRAALSRRATETGLTESDVLRSALAVALNDDGSHRQYTPAISDASEPEPQIKLSVRILRPVAERLDRKARAAGLSRGAYLTGLINGAPAVVAATDRRAGFAALSASAAELALLSRDINHLTHLLRRGEVRAAQEYQARLDSLDADVRQHLDRSAAALAELAPPQAHARRILLGPPPTSGRRP